MYQFQYKSLKSPRIIECLILLFMILGIDFYSHECKAQFQNKLDSIRTGKLKLSQSKFINNIFVQALNSMEKPTAGVPELQLKSGKIEKPFLPYQGKIIRHIQIHTYNFDRSLKDTTKQDNSRMGRLGKRMHSVTKHFLVKDNLFITENTPLNAFKVADNERFLRTLEYLHEARIKVKAIKNNPDSVDVDVYTIDVLSIAGGFASNGLNHFNGNIFETNFGGIGQRIELDELYDYKRKPVNGNGLLYKKSNLFHSFVDLTAGISTMSQNGTTHEEETTEYFTLNRQLISAYSRTAGGIQISHNEANNLYGVPSQIFFKYKYDYFDFWGGYNIGIKKLTATNNTIRDRRFLALRFYKRNFTEIPSQIKSFDPVFNSSTGALAQISFFRQDYYRTQFIYGFGTTEDLPYGYNLGTTFGWHRQLELNRFYSGLNAYDYVATSHGDFLQFYLKVGGFLYKNQIQDGSVLLGVTAFSRLFFWNSTKIRQYVNISFSNLNNRTTNAPLRIDNYYGIRGFLSDSVAGAMRLSLQTETAFFLNFKIYGFKFAPFPYFDVSLIAPESMSFLKSSLYASLGGGIRMRNESLVFETIELRAYFFPVAPNNMKGFKVILNSNIRYRYLSNFISEPDFVQLNTQ